jgi:hypothetical protein
LKLLALADEVKEMKSARGGKSLRARHTTRGGQARDDGDGSLSPLPRR